MAVFHDPWAEQKLDWLILQSSPVVLYCSVEAFRADLAWFEEEGYSVVMMDCAAWRSSSQAHRSLKKSLQFPSYYGANFPALNDCLSDLEISDEGGLVVGLSGFHRFAEREPDFAQSLLDCLASNARYHLLFGKRLLALVQSDDPDIEFAPVGACPVVWNGREFLRSERKPKTS